MTASAKTPTYEHVTTALFLLALFLMLGEPNVISPRLTEFIGPRAASTLLGAIFVAGSGATWYADFYKGSFRITRDTFTLHIISVFMGIMGVYYLYWAIFGGT